MFGAVPLMAFGDFGGGGHGRRKVLLGEPLVDVAFHPERSAPGVNGNQALQADGAHEQAKLSNTGCLHGRKLARGKER